MRGSGRPLRASVVVLCVLVIVGCGGGTRSASRSAGSSSPAGSSSVAGSNSVAASGGGGGPVAQADPSVQKLLPPAIRASGTLTVAADATYAPDEFVAPGGHTIVGMDADLVKALAAVMGLKAKLINVDFTMIIPGVAAGRYDLGASSIADTKARERVVDFVDYFIGGESFYTRATGGRSITGIADICGASVAVESGTTEQADASAQSRRCVAAGKPAVKVLVFVTQTAANRAVASGQAELGFADSPAAEYQVKQSGGELELVGASYANSFDGLACSKATGLARAVLAALKDVTASGQYLEILSKWGIQADAIPASELQINGATS